MSQAQRKILLHLPSTLLPLDTGAKRKFLGLLKYFRDRKEFLAVDAFGTNDFRHIVWTLEQSQEVLKSVDNFFVYSNEHNLFNYAYSRSKSFYYQRLLRKQLPIDSDYWSPPGYVKFVHSLILKHEYDAIFIHHLDYAYLALNSPLPSIQTILDIVDLRCQLRLARKNIYPLIGLSFDYEANFLKEVQLMSKFDTVIVTSQKEMEMIEKHMSPDKLHLIPYTMEELCSKDRIIPYSQREFKYDLMYVGAPYYPNIEGLNFFFSSIFPKIVDKKPDIRFAIAGKVGDFIQVDDLFKQNVDCLGYVPDLVDLYFKSKIVICPLLSGSGTKIKLQEAMNYAIPIVTTTTGASGLSLKDGINAFITDEPDSFAYRVLDLLERPEVARKFSREINTTFENEYSSSVAYSKLDDVFGISPSQSQLLST